MNQFEKQPAEAYVIGIEWQNKLPAGASLFSGTVDATRLVDGVQDNTVISNTLASVSGTQSFIKVQSGVHGMDYRITFLMTLTNGDLLEEDVFMQVRQI